MHRHVLLHSGTVAEANVLPQVLTTMRGASSGSTYRMLWTLRGIWRRVSPRDAWSGGQHSGNIR